MLGFRPSRKKNKDKEIEPQEVFLDNLAQRKEEEFGITKKRKEVPLPVNALIFFFTIITLLFFSLFVRAFQMQHTQHEYFVNRSTRNILSISTMQLLRGVIYDRDYNQLVFNSPQYDLYYRGNIFSEEEESDIYEISKIINKNPDNIISTIKDSESVMVLIKRGLEHEEIVQIEARKKKLPNFILSSTAGREYPGGENFAHILGYIGKINREELKKNPNKYTIHDYIGKTGVEKYYEDYLTRVGDTIKIEKDAAGRAMSTEIIQEGESGQNIVLTIDSRLQEITEKKARERLEEIGARKTAIVALNPQTGEILAMSSIPSFDNNIFSKGSDQEILRDLLNDKDAVFLNRAISARYPTGSIIKPLLGAAALQENLITPGKRIYSRGYITIPNPWNPSQPTIFRDFQAHGWRDMREAIAVSSNVYFYAIGGGYEDQKGLGAEKIKKYLSLFGWNDKTGIDIYGEKSGFIPSPEWKRKELNDIWRIGDTYNLSIGQGFLSTTPLQVAVSYAALVNGGEVLRPYVVKEIIDDERNILEKREKEIIRDNFISPENLEVIKEGMREATKIGTARSLQLLPVTSGAKTGTAQTSIPGINNNWVTLFAPYDNPEIVMTVIVKEVKGVTPVATHLARDILLEYFKENKNLEKNY